MSPAKCSTASMPTSAPPSATGSPRSASSSGTSAGSAALQEPLDDGHGGRLAHVVRARLEGQAPYRDHLARQRAEVGGDAGHERPALRLVGIVHRLDDAEVHARLLARADGGLDVLGEAGPAVADAGEQ